MGGYQRKVDALDWDRNSRFLATANGPDLAVWDCSGAGPEGRTPQEFIWHEKNITVLTYQRLGDLLVTGGEEGCVAFWKTEAREFPVGKLQLSDAISQTVWSPDEKRIAVATASGEVRVFTF
jgi:WD40 repeat protein